MSGYSTNPYIVLNVNIARRGKVASALCYCYWEFTMVQLLKKKKERKNCLCGSLAITESTQEETIQEKIMQVLSYLKGISIHQEQTEKSMKRKNTGETSAV